MGAILGVRAGKLAYRNMKSRWGSCQPSTGRICINVRLALYPPECLEYVVVHELCHLLVHGHGPGFPRAARSRHARLARAPREAALRAAREALAGRTRYGKRPRGELIAHRKVFRPGADGSERVAVSAVRRLVCVFEVSDSRICTTCINWGGFSGAGRACWVSLLANGFQNCRSEACGFERRERLKFQMIQIGRKWEFASPDSRHGAPAGRTRARRSLAGRTRCDKRPRGDPERRGAPARCRPMFRCADLIAPPFILVLVNPSKLLLFT